MLLILYEIFVSTIFEIREIFLFTHDGELTVDDNVHNFHNELLLNT